MVAGALASLLCVLLLCVAKLTVKYACLTAELCFVDGEAADGGGGDGGAAPMES